MNIFEELMNDKQEISIFTFSKMAYKHVYITKVTQLRKGYVIELTNSERGIQLYGKRKSVVNTESIERIEYLEKKDEGVL